MYKSVCKVLVYNFINHLKTQLKNVQLSRKQVLPPWGHVPWTRHNLLSNSETRKQQDTHIHWSNMQKTLYSHNTSFNNPKLNQTSLSNFVRKLQDKKIQHTISNEKIDQAKSFSPVSGICALCTQNKIPSPLSQGWAQLTRKTKCSITAYTREEYYYVKKEDLTCSQVSDDCTC